MNNKYKLKPKNGNNQTPMMRDLHILLFKILKKKKNFKMLNYKQV